MRLRFPYLNKTLVACVLILLTVATPAQQRNCLRVMPVEELSRSATLIARVKVLKADRARFDGNYGQVARVQTMDVIEGDFTLKELQVLAKSAVRCADDTYTEGQEMLVFLVPDRGLYHTLNFQFGQFQIAAELVRGWRDKQ